MDNNTNDNTDKYTNYSYQGSPSGSSAPNTYSEPTPDEYKQPGYNTQYNPYAKQEQNTQYDQPMQYSQPGQYSQSVQYSQPNQYTQPTQYSQPGQYTQANQYSQSNQYDQYSYDPYNGTVQSAPAPSKGPAIASMVCGIASLCTAFAGVVFGIIALVLSSKFRASNNGRDNGFSTAGKICGIIRIIISAIWIIAYVGIIVAAIAAAGSYGAYYS